MMRTIFLACLFCVGAIVVSVLLVQNSGNDAPIGIVIPHHDMVASTRQAYLAEVAETTSPKTIILISPDHFDRATESIVTTDRIWTTKIGDIFPAEEVISSINVPLDADAFDGEHGVTSLLRDIKTYFPESTLVPILANRSATYVDMSELVEKLYAACADCLLIASVDFSHTQNALLADLHDRLSLRGLVSMDSELVYKNAEVDSPESLVALMLWSRMHGAQKFSLFEHTNSGFLTDTEVGEITTHIIGGYYPGSVSEVAPSFTFMIGGDMMFARDVVDSEFQNQDPLGVLGERFFWGVDSALVNLEGVFATSTTYSDGWNDTIPRLLFSPKYITSIRDARIESVSLANNHTHDGDEAALAYTQELLSKNDINYFGDEQNAAGSSMRIAESNGMKVAFFGVHAHESFSGIIGEIEAVQKDHKVVVYVHWGTEYQAKHNAAQEGLAHDLVDAGADLVVGAHPHVVQDMEVYKNVPIIYSLGNFLFDQNFSEETQIGAVAAGEFTEKGLEMFLIPVQSYLVTNILSPDEHRTYIENWSASFREYQTEKQSYFFPNM